MRPKHSVDVISSGRTGNDLIRIRHTSSCLALSMMPGEQKTLNTDLIFELSAQQPGGAK